MLKKGKASKLEEEELAELTWSMRHFKGYCLPRESGLTVRGSVEQLLLQHCRAHEAGAEGGTAATDAASTPTVAEQKKEMMAAAAGVVVSEVKAMSPMKDEQDECTVLSDNPDDWLAELPPSALVLLENSIPNCNSTEPRKQTAARRRAAGVGSALVQALGPNVLLTSLHLCVGCRFTSRRTAVGQ